jgi:hypothetical protein
MKLRLQFPPGPKTFVYVDGFVSASVSDRCWNLSSIGASTRLSSLHSYQGIYRAMSRTIPSF